jgi:SAM-dependent methyltransferase
MSNANAAIRGHYGISGMLARIEAALAAGGTDPRHPSYRDLLLFDQLHEGGSTATREHARRIGIGAGTYLLDLGCGIGGASRLLAAEFGCRVTGIDLTSEFVAVARELTARCGLADRIDYRAADALDLPFAEATFDHVWSQFVTMNIADKAGLAREVHRVLRPGGRFSCAELNLGPHGEPIFPLPWAADPSYSFLVAPNAMRDALLGAGLRIVEAIDLSAASIAYVEEMSRRLRAGEQPDQRNDVVMGEGFRERGRNVARCYKEGRIVSRLVIAEKL